MTDARDASEEAEGIPTTGNGSPSPAESRTAYAASWRYCPGWLPAARGGSHERS